MLEKILVSLDGSSLSELALIYAKELASVFNSEIYLYITSLYIAFN
jgi:nucleotide-binding universal stress UspA family protein